jgi:tetratricopeptide (TPR) repeat protein
VPGANEPTAAPGLPTAPRLFLGRNGLLDELCTELLRSPAPAVALLGPGGIGKSSLTLQALHRPDLAARFGARRWFVRLDTAPTAEAALALVAEALGLRPQQPLLPAVCAFVGQASGVLALDNLETPWEGELEETEKLLLALKAAPNLALVISLRGAQRPAGLGAKSIRVPQLDEAAATDLFCQIADAKHDDPSLAPLLALLDGVPLAITLLAHVAEGASLASVLAAWQQKQTALLARDGVKPGRETSWRVSVALSVESRRMTDEARRLLALLGRLPDGVAVADLDALLPEKGHEAAVTLVHVGLAYDDKNRVRVLAPVREYARTEVPPAPDDIAVARGHYAKLGKELGSQTASGKGAEVLARFAPELANIDAMLREGLTTSTDPTPWIDASTAMRDFAYFSRHSLASTFKVALEAARRTGDVFRQAVCLHALGKIASSRSDDNNALQCHKQALRLFCKAKRALSEDGKVKAALGEADCIFYLGDIARIRSNYDEACRRYEQARARFRKVGWAQGEANCIHGLANVAMSRLRHDEAQRLYEEARALSRSKGDALGEANCLQDLGDLALARSDPSTAREQYRAALLLYTRVPEPYSMGVMHRQLARLAADDAERQTHVAAARELWAQIDRLDLVAKLDTEFGHAPFRTSALRRRTKPGRLRFAEAPCATSPFKPSARTTRGPMSELA